MEWEKQKSRTVYLPITANPNSLSIYMCTVTYYYPIYQEPFILQTYIRTYEYTVAMHKVNNIMEDRTILLFSE